MYMTLSGFPFDFFLFPFFARRCAPGCDFSGVFHDMLTGCLGKEIEVHGQLTTQQLTIYDEASVELAAIGGAIMRYCLILLCALFGGCGHVVVSEKLLDAVIQGQAGYAESQAEVLQLLAELQKELQAVANWQVERGSDQGEASTAQTRLLERLVRLQNEAQVTTKRQMEQGDKQVNYARAQLERLEQLYQRQAEQHMEIKARMDQQAQCDNGQTALVMELVRLREELQAQLREIQAQADQLKECLIGEAARLCNDVAGRNTCR